MPDFITRTACCHLQAAAWCAVNGLGLAMVIPCIQSILAEIWPAKQRGRAFGSLFTFSALGGIGRKYEAILIGTELVGNNDVSVSPHFGSERVLPESMSEAGTATQRSHPLCLAGQTSAGASSIEESLWVAVRYKLQIMMRVASAFTKCTAASIP